MTLDMADIKAVQEREREANDDDDDMGPRPIFFATGGSHALLPPLPIAFLSSEISNKNKTWVDSRHPLLPSDTLFLTGWQQHSKEGRNL